MTFFAAAGAFLGTTAGAATIGAAGAIGGGLLAANASKGAANTEAQAAANSIEAQRQAMERQIGLQEPWRQAGMAGLSKLNALLGLPQQTPTGGATMLQPGSDGVFTPAGMTGGADLGGSFRTDTKPLGLTMGTPLVPQGQFNEQAYLQANPDVAAAVQRGETSAYQHYVNFGQHEQRSLGDTTSQVYVPTAQGSAGAPATPTTANTLGGAGSLNQPFSAADFAADGAPKSDPFVNPNALPTFEQTAPQFNGYQQRDAAGTIGQYGGAQNLQGFTDLPAFNADAMRDDPGYQFRAQQQQQALDRAAAAQGRFGSGGYLKDAMTYAGNLASQEYGNSFNRYQTTRNNLLQDYTTNRDTTQANNANALTTYTTNRATQQQNTDNTVRDFNDNLAVQQANYGTARSAYDQNFNQAQINRTNAVNDNKDAMSVYSLNRNNGLQDYQTAYDRFQTNRLNVLNPLLAVSGFGQQAATTTGAAAQNFGNQAAAAIQTAGSARAAGQVGAANAVTGAIGQGLSTFQQNQLLNRFPAMNLGSGVTPPNPYFTGATSTPMLGSAYSGF